MPIGGVDHVDQIISTYTINLHTKKWWWPLFWFIVDVAVNNAYQIYHKFHWNPGKYRMDALGFCWDIVDAYYLFAEGLLPTTLFTGSHSLYHPANNLQIYGINHWIAQGSQRWCSLPECKGTSVVVYGQCWGQISKQNSTPSFNNTPLKKIKIPKNGIHWNN